MVILFYCLLPVIRFGSHAGSAILNKMRACLAYQLFSGQDTCPGDDHDARPRLADSRELILSNQIVCHAPVFFVYYYIPNVKTVYKFNRRIIELNSLGRSFQWHSARQRSSKNRAAAAGRPRGGLGARATIFFHFVFP